MFAAPKISAIANLKNLAAVIDANHSRILCDDALDGEVLLTSCDAARTAEAAAIDAAVPHLSVSISRVALGYQVHLATRIDVDGETKRSHVLLGKTPSPLNATLIFARTAAAIGHDDVDVNPSIAMPKGEVTRDNATENAPYCFTTFASDLGLRAGQWPATLTTVLGNGRPFVKKSALHNNGGDLEHVTYRQELGCTVLTVYND